MIGLALSLWQRWAMYAAILIVVFLAGDWRGSARVTAAYEAEKAEARGIASERYATQLTRATDASLANQGVALELNTTLHVTRTRTREIVKEVNADVEAHPDLLRCLVPDATRRLRDEQVARSAELAAENRPVQQ
ncbi:MAG TPA: hypothetical protein PLR28_11220 [Dokdonella sp.]|nr:hypothetical protein [Dokdonella sp.]